MDSVKVLDKGYIKLIETWGSDERIIEAARMSTDKGFQGWGPKHKSGCLGEKAQEGKATYTSPDRLFDGCQEAGDEKLLKYLYQNKHDTPFEMAGLIFEIKAPIFVFREWHRHRTQSYNELSSRYTEFPNEFYVPSIERIQNAVQSTKNKQGSEAGFTPEFASDFQDFIEESYQHARADYETMLTAGIAREIARLVIPVAQYSKMRASANLRNWLAFLTLRSAGAAQFEIRQYAIEVGKIIAEKFPRTWELYVQGR
jgi:thymidylate synthase (FAD)